ncbi:MAG: cyclic nucleotide-binding domain-containing protein [Treponema sp.]|nr:cyclic nucleotide-binding domain-containing protein [Treponema sp.]
MPKPFQYGSGSVIYFQGDAADKIFLVQKGAVNLIYQDMETGLDAHDLLQPGEFFGVKSALGRFPREENAQALAETTIMAFTVAEFEAFAMANTRIVMKMLKVFSNQMRRIHKQVSSLMEKEEVNPDAGLFNTGEYYLKNKRYSQAKYVFSRYLTYYPSGKNAAQAAKNLETAEISIARYGDGNGPSVPLSGSHAHQEETAPAAPSASSAAPSPAKDSAAAKAYYDAVSLISQDKYQQAYMDFKKIAEAGNDPEWSIRSFFEMGRCLFFLNKFEDVIKHYTAMLTKYPQHPDLRDAMFYIGQSYEKIGSTDKAAAFYKKVLSMNAEEGDGTTLKTKRALKTLGVM